MHVRRVASVGNGALAVVISGALFPLPLLSAAQHEPGPAPPGQVPVLLVPGWGDTAADLIPLRDSLTGSGWPGDHVSALTFSDAFGSNGEHAAEIDEEITRLLERTGEDQVDIVAHSMGGLAVRLVLASDTQQRVRRVVFLATPHRGTVMALFGWGDGATEMVPGSEFLERLNKVSPPQDAPEILALRSPLDLVVIPSDSAILPGARNEEVCCPTHQGLLTDGEAVRRIRAFLTATDEVSLRPGALRRRAP